MRLIKKFLKFVLVIFVLALAGLAATLAYTEKCEGTPSAVEGGMTAAFAHCYGSADVITLEKVAIPQPADDEILVQVKAAAVNPLDYHEMRGSPYIMRLMRGIGKPERASLGADFSGVVVAVGDEVTNFKPGDEVFGGSRGAFAEYLTIRADRSIVRKPSNVSFAEAAAIPVAALTALQALVDHGELQTGERVLINGASGGVGTYTTQIATALGAEVSGVCSTRNVEMVKALGAKQVFDYKKENYTESGQKFDLIVDMVGNHSISANRDVLTDNGRLIIVGGPKGDWIAPLIYPIKALVTQPFVNQKIASFVARLKQDDLDTLANMMAEGKLTSQIDRTYPLEQIADAIRYSESGRARGKIIVAVGE
ncbi:MAG: NAD(P)-dependent alcohol dehydrogenase [Pseudomonadota bacterium]